MKEKKYISDIPELMKEWDWEANADLDPSKITCGSHKKVGWKCSKCSYCWKSVVKDRCLSHQGCPACVGKVLIVGKNDLLTIRPDIAAQWHPFKNGNLQPQDVMSGSGKDRWWQCQKCGYEWQANPNNRKRRDDDKCPQCVKNKHYINRGCVLGNNDLLTMYPDLSKEWHPTKNDDLKPENMTPGSSKKVWWKCPHGHEYKSSISNRVRGTNCPMCNIGRKTSFAEQAFYFYIKQLFPDAVNQYKADFLGKMELDIYIPSIRCAIEYDGKPWHGKGFKGKREREERKYSVCNQNNIKLIRVREGTVDGDMIIADCQFEVSHLNRKNYLDNTIKAVLKHLLEKQSFVMNDISVNTERDRFKILSVMNVIRKNNSFAEQYPELIKEWHPTKNENITPYMFMPGSKVKVWWKCPACCNEYQQTISHRSKRGQGCPMCGRKKISRAFKLSVQKIDMKSGQIIETYDSVKEAAIDVKIAPSSISMVCTGLRKTAGGYKWRYINAKVEHKSKKTKAIYMISILTHKVIKKFVSVREAAKEMGFYEGCIRKACMGNRKSAFGYIWRYVDEKENEKHQKSNPQLELDLKSK